MDEKIEHSFIANHKVGDQFDGIYFCSGVSIKNTSGGKPYSDFELRDSSGIKSVKLWSSTEIPKNSWVYAKMLVQEYQGSPSYVASLVNLADKPEDISFYIQKIADYDNAVLYFKSNFRLENLPEGNEDKSEKLLTLAETCGLLTNVLTGKDDAALNEFCSLALVGSPRYSKIGGNVSKISDLYAMVSTLKEVFMLSDDEVAVIKTAIVATSAGALDGIDMENCVPKLNSRGEMASIGLLSVARITNAVNKIVKELKAKNIKPHNDALARVLHCMAVNTWLCDKTLTKEAAIFSRIVSLVDGLDSEISALGGN